MDNILPELKLPTIALSAFERTSKEQQATTLKLLRDACADYGFFCITDHGIEQQLLDDAIRVSRQYFSLPEDIKKQASQEDLPEFAMHSVRERGYVGGEFYNKNPLDSDAPLDLNEAFIFSANLSPAQISYLNPIIREQDYADNVWPENLPEMQTIMHCYYEALKHLAFRIHQLLQLALDFAVPPFAEHSSLVRINYYPPVTEEPAKNQWRISQHDDICLFTILLPEPKEGKTVDITGNRAGLEVLHNKHGWCRALYDTKSFVINAGYTMNRASITKTGEYSCKSSLHRVSVPSPSIEHDNSRVSIAYLVLAEHDLNQESMKAYQDLVERSL